MRYLWGASSPSATTTSVRTSTSSIVATRPADVGAAVCAQHWLTTPICAPSTESTSTSDRKSLNVVSQTFFPLWVQIFKLVHCSQKMNKSKVCVEHCVLFLHRCGVSWRHVVQLLRVLLWAVLPCSVWHGDMQP